MKDKLIVGIDPGTTAGVALINLNGKLIDVKSGRDFGKEKIIAYIISKGSPVMMATDKKKVPSTVEKISRSFDVKLVSPDKDLSQEEKDELVGDVGINDSHQLDALASALYAYKIHSENLNKIEETMQKLNLLDQVEEVKVKFLRGESENITAAIESVLEDGDEKIEEAEEKNKNDKEENMGVDEKVVELKEELSQTKNVVKTLREYSEKLKKQNKDLEERLSKRKDEVKHIKKGRKDEVMKMDEIKKLAETVQSLRRGLKKQESKNKKLEEKLDKFKEIEMNRRKGLVPVYTVKNFNRNDLEKVKEIYGIENSLLMFENIESPNLSIIDDLKENKVKAVLGNFEGKLKEELLEKDIPIIDMDLSGDGEVKFAKIEDIESGKKINKEGFISWLKNYKKR
ncbi:MAG: DUF460 domain-containing protein [Candidatus Aenigmatarchaeota archaeon]